MIKLRFFLYSFLSVIIIVLAYFYFCPLGKTTYQHDFSRKYYNFSGGQGFFHKLGPADRVVDKNKIIGDPAYFYLRTPGRFSLAQLKIKYRLSPAVLASDDFLNMEIGVLLDKDNWRFSLYPFFNNYLNNLNSDWDYQSSEGLSFYQRDKKFNNYLSFIKNNDFSRAVFYNYSFNYDYLMANYQPDRSGPQEAIKNIRGSYSFLTYIKNEDLKVDFSFSNKDLSPLKSFSLYVYFQDKIILDKNFSDSDLANDNRFSLNLPDLPEGVYKVELKANDNLITNSLISYNSKLVFLNRIWLSDLSEGWTVFSNKNNFRIKALESDCLGDIKINQENFVVNEIFQQFNFSVDNPSNNLNKIESSSCGLLIENNGLFAFQENYFFNPTLNKLDHDSNLENIDFIVAKYQKPYIEGDYLVSEVELSLDQAYKDKDGYQFIISAPFLGELNPEKYLEIKSIELKLKKRPLSF